MEQKTAKRMGPSQTAQLAAAHRAYRLMRDRPTVLEDSAAIWLLGPPLSVVLRVAPLRWLFWERLLARFRPVSVFVVLRSRYAEDRLERSISDGCRQYVILGAGLDSWALRHETPVVTVFELDHPATQQWKEARIRARLGRVPSHLTLIPIDFERQTVADALRGQQFDRDSQAFVSWLGTTYYLTRSAIEATLASLARICAPGSQVVFDYFQPKSMMSPADLRLFEEINRHATRRGEPLLTLLGSDDVLGMMQSTGYPLLRTGRHLRPGDGIYISDQTGSTSPALCDCVVQKLGPNVMNSIKKFELISHTHTVVEV